MEQPSPAKVFISYSPKDETYRDELLAHLSPLRHEGAITTWHDGTVLFGERQPQIDEQLDAADVVVLLISADYLASDYLHSHEMQRALRRHERGEAKVLPVLVRPVDRAPVGDLQTLPKGTEAISRYKDRDEGWASVVSALRVGLRRAEGIEGTAPRVRIKSDARQLSLRVKMLWRHRRGCVFSIVLGAVLALSILAWALAAMRLSSAQRPMIAVPANISEPARAVGADAGTEPPPSREVTAPPIQDPPAPPSTSRKPRMQSKLGLPRGPYIDPPVLPSADPTSPVPFTSVPSDEAKLTVTAKGGSCSVTVDGKSYGASPVSIAVAPGRHSVHCTTAVTKSERVVTVVPGAAETIVFNIGKAAPIF